MINAQVDDLSSHNTKYTSPALTKKVFANMRRIGKGFSRVETLLFDDMLVQQQVQDDVAEVEEDEDNEVSTVPTLPSPTHATTPPSPQQEPISSPPQAQSAQPSSPPQQQPSLTAAISKSSVTLLNTLMETYATLTQKVAHLEQDKVAQDLEITKLKQRVKKLEKKRKLKSSGLKRLKKVESQAKAYNLDLQHSEKFLCMQDTNEAEPAEVEEVLEVVTAANLIKEVVTTAAPITTAAQVSKASAPRRRRGIIIKDHEEITTASVIVHSEVQSKDKGKGILIKEPKPLKGQVQIDMDEAFARQLEAELNANINWNDVIEQVKQSEKEDNIVIRYQALKRKNVTEAQVRKNMMIYLKNMAGFKMNFFKGITYNEIRPLFKKHYNSNQVFLERVEEEVIVQKKEIEEEGSKRKGESLKQKIAKKQRMDEETGELKRHLQIVANDDDDDVYTKATPLASKVHVVDYQIHHENNKPYYKIITVDGTHKLLLSFITLLNNIDRKDLETLWKLVKERFKSTKPKNFSDDFFCKYSQDHV
nr:hypothetical protein [Tanacetum cinerariifolium]